MTEPRSNEIIADSSINSAIAAESSIAFSSAATSVVKEKASQYMTGIVAESAAVARRDNSDIVSAKHVEIASDNITSHSRGRLYKHIGTWGGIFLGASLSTLTSMILQGFVSVPGVVSIAVFGIAGAYLLGRSIAI